LPRHRLSALDGGVLRSVLGDPVLQRDGIDTLLGLDTGERNVGRGMSCGAESALISKITTAPEIPATFIRRLGRDEASSRRRGFEIDLRRYLLLRTNYCSPLEERVDRRPAGPRSLPLKMDKRDALPIASAPLYLLRIGSGAFRFCRYLCCDAARLW